MMISMMDNSLNVGNDMIKTIHAQFVIDCATQYIEYFVSGAGFQYSVALHLELVSTTANATQGPGKENGEWLLWQPKCGCNVLTRCR